MSLDIKIGKKIHATYEGVAELYFLDDRNPAEIYLAGWKRVEHEVLSQISLDGLRVLSDTMKHHMFEGMTGSSIVIVVRVEASSHG